MEHSDLRRILNERTQDESAKHRLNGLSQDENVVT